MKNFISYEKLSKKEKRKLDREKRVVWSDLGGFSPVSRIVEDKKKKQSVLRCRKYQRYL